MCNQVLAIAVESVWIANVCTRGFSGLSAQLGNQAMDALITLAKGMHLDGYANL